MSQFMAPDETHTAGGERVGEGGQALTCVVLHAGISLLQGVQDRTLSCVGERAQP